MPPKDAEAKQQTGKAGAKKGQGKAAAKKANLRGKGKGKGKGSYPVNPPPGIGPPPGMGGPYLYHPSYPVGWPPAPPPFSDSESVMWVTAPMMPWGPPGLGWAPTEGAKGAKGGKGAKGLGKNAKLVTQSFCSGEFWYASTAQRFDELISTTGIDCSKGKHRGRVFCHRSREDAEATAMKFKIGRVHKINMAEMEKHYSGPNGKGGAIWTHGPTVVDVSDLPPEDQNFVRPQFIETFEVRLPSKPDSKVADENDVETVPLAVAVAGGS